VTATATIQAPAVIAMARGGSTVVASARLDTVNAREGSSQPAAPQPSCGSARLAAAASRAAVPSTVAARSSSSRKLRSGAASPIS
jgi:hypothetical protein